MVLFPRTSIFCISALLLLYCIAVPTLTFLGLNVTAIHVKSPFLIVYAVVYLTIAPSGLWGVIGAFQNNPLLCARYVRDHWFATVALGIVEAVKLVFAFTLSDQTVQSCVASGGTIGSCQAKANLSKEAGIIFIAGQQFALVGLGALAFFSSRTIKEAEAERRKAALNQYKEDLDALRPSFNITTPTRLQYQESNLNETNLVTYPPYLMPPSRGQTRSNRLTRQRGPQEAEISRTKQLPFPQSEYNSRIAIPPEQRLGSLSLRREPTKNFGTAPFDPTLRVQNQQTLSPTEFQTNTSGAFALASSQFVRTPQPLPRIQSQKIPPRNIPLQNIPPPNIPPPNIPPPNIPPPNISQLNIPPPPIPNYSRPPRDRIRRSMSQGAIPLNSISNRQSRPLPVPPVLPMSLILKELREQSSLSPQQRSQGPSRQPPFRQQELPEPRLLPPQQRLQETFRPKASQSRQQPPLRHSTSLPNIAYPNYSFNASEVPPVPPIPPLPTLQPPNNFFTNILPQANRGNFPLKQLEEQAQYESISRPSVVSSDSLYSYQSSSGSRPKSWSSSKNEQFIISRPPFDTPYLNQAVINSRNLGVGIRNNNDYRGDERYVGIAGNSRGIVPTRDNRNVLIGGVNGGSQGIIVQSGNMLSVESRRDGYIGQPSREQMRNNMMPRQNNSYKFAGFV